MAKRRPHRLDQALDKRDERIPKICEMYLKGRTFGEIGAALDVSRECISRTVRYMRRVWILKADREIDRLFAEQLQRIDLVESEAWESWEKSKAARRSASVKKNSAGKIEEKRLTKEQSDGDPKFLAVILDCIHRRSRLLSLEKRNERGEATQGVDIVEIVVDTPEQAAELMNYESYRAGQLGVSKVTTIEARNVEPVDDESEAEE